MITGSDIIAHDPAILEIGTELQQQEVGGAKVDSKPQAPKEVDASEIVSSDSGTDTEVLLGRGQRVTILSVKLTDYVTYNAICNKNSTPHVLSYSVFFDPVPGNTLYSLTEYISDERFSVEHRAFLTSVCAESKPKSFQEAMRD